MLVTSGLADTIATGTGAGTGPTVAITGASNGGRITLTTGTLPAGTNATIVTVTYPTACPTGSAATLTGGNANEAALSGVTGTYAVGSAGSFTLNSGTTALAGSTQYIWNYHVTCW